MYYSIIILCSLCFSCIGYVIGYRIAYKKAYWKGWHAGEELSNTYFPD